MQGASLPQAPRLKNKVKDAVGSELGNTWYLGLCKRWIVGVAAGGRLRDGARDEMVSEMG